jgi:hypothetical protein
MELFILTPKELNNFDTLQRNYEGEIVIVKSSKKPSHPTCKTTFVENMSLLS